MLLDDYLQLVTLSGHRNTLAPFLVMAFVLVQSPNHFQHILTTLSARYLTPTLIFSHLTVVGAMSIVAPLQA